MNEADEDDTAKPGGVSRATAEERVADWERRARLTANPLYVWRAMLSCFMYEIPLTEYCLDYIKHSSVQFFDLIEDATSEKPTIDPLKAVTAVPRVLQITNGQGKPNAFELLRRDRQREMDASREDAARVFGQEPKHRRVDERNLRKYIKKGRELGGWAKPPPKP
jgi:hypothetical protein